eukprot:TRINITY_DN28171_c0_g1_i1.p1 TRINITY_DN28171_c0_g1~~TRINITY_DN28171_c0_g1_i1.p1  ORF type:complete len:152 (-),score=13.96 TRINITY_DN28171_c0_g1_i1:211-666(-)
MGFLQMGKEVMLDLKKKAWAIQSQSTLRSIHEISQSLLRNWTFREESPENVNTREENTICIRKEEGEQKVLNYPGLVARGSVLNLLACLSMDSLIFPYEIIDTVHVFDGASWIKVDILTGTLERGSIVRIQVQEPIRIKRRARRIRSKYHL